MVWMTAVLAMEQKAAQGINLLYFLPTAVCALIFHAKHRQICWKAVVPAALAGCAAAVPGALLAASLEMELLRAAFRRLPHRRRPCGNLSARGLQKNSA